MKKEDIKGWIIFGIIAVAIIALFFWGFYSYINRDYKKMKICAEEYGLHKDNFWNEAEGSLRLNYTYEYVGEDSFACCQRTNFLVNGEIRHLNCTSVHSLEEIKNE